jgi:N-methylhydantoinase B/oxoprolinase/acetone carboxylase alpha subunit
VALTILFGVYPKPVLDMSAASVQQLVNNYNAAVTAVKAAALVVSKAAAMSFSSAGYQLLPVLPELVLAVGAMVLLMLGAYRGEGTTRLVTTPCGGAAGRHRRAGTDAAGRQAHDLRRQLHRRRLCPLPEDPLRSSVRR